MVVFTEGKRARPKLTRVDPRVIDEVVPARICVDQHLAPTRHVTLAQQATAGDVQEQVCTSDDSFDRGRVEAGGAAIRGPKMPATAEAGRKPGQFAFEKRDAVRPVVVIRLAARIVCPSA